MESLQSRNQVVDKRAEPDEKRAGNSPLVRRRSDHPVEFAVYEEITESNDRTDSTSGTSVETISVQSSPTESPVMSPRREAVNSCVRVSNAGPSPSAQTVKYRRHVNVTSTVPSRGPVAVFSQKPSVAAWIQRCFRVPHLFGLPSSRKVDSSNRTHIPAISGIAANGSGMVDKIAKTSSMMCWYLLMVGITFCLDRAVHVPHGADACLTNSSFVDTFHVDPWNSRGDLEQRVQRRVRRNRVDLVQVGGQVTNPEDRDTAVRLRGYVMPDYTDLQQCQIEQVGEQNWKSAGDRSLSSWSCRTRNHNLFWRMLQTWLGTSIVVVEECFTEAAYVWKCQ